MIDQHRGAILFDLDGTFVDTSTDLFAALNLAVTAEGCDEISVSHLRPLISSGSHELVRAALPEFATEKQIQRCRVRFLDAYAANCTQHTQPVDGIEALLQKIQQRAIAWGIVTNKRTRFTERLIASMPLTQPIPVVVSGDTLEYAKPDPAPLLYACDQLQVNPARSVYIGDAPTDVTAAHAAGMHAVVAAWGYIAADDDPAAWEPDAIAAHPAELLRWLDYIDRDR